MSVLDRCGHSLSVSHLLIGWADAAIWAQDHIESKCLRFCKWTEEMYPVKGIIHMWMYILSSLTQTHVIPKLSTEKNQRRFFLLKNHKLQWPVLKLQKAPKRPLFWSHTIAFYKEQTPFKVIHWKSSPPLQLSICIFQFCLSKMVSQWHQKWCNTF